MGAFDDLIPTGTGMAQKGGRPSTTGAGAFDDLIPAASTRRATPARSNTEKPEGFAEGAVNVVKGAGERVGDLMAGVGDTTIGLLTGAGLSPDNPFVANLRRGTEKARDADFGYVEGTSWEDFKENPLGNFVPFALEQGLISVPDMVAALTVLPAYVYSRTGEMADQRADNNDIDDATIGDLVRVLPAAVGASLLERLGGKGMFGIDDAAVTAAREIPTAIGKAAVTEAGTEALQEGIESTATTLGTNKGFDLAETGEQMLAGAVGGAGFGGAIRAGTATGEVATYRGQNADVVTPEGASPAGTLLGEVEGETDTVAPIPVDRERLGSTRLTDEDRASPISNDLIDDGKAIMEGRLPNVRGGGLAGALLPDRVADIQRQGDEALADLRFEADVQDALDREIANDNAFSDLTGPAFERDIQRASMRGGFADALAGRQFDRDIQAGAIEAGNRSLAFDRSIQNAVSHNTRDLTPSGDGSKRAPLKLVSSQDLDGIAPRIATPTPAQAEAGNYAKGHARWQGMDIAIETPKGGTRRGVGRDGTAWEVTMPAHYGDIKGTKGADGDPIDVYFGDDAGSDRVFVVDQKDADTGKFDEVKVFVGVTDETDVARIYEGAFSDGRATDRLQAITETTVAGLKDWLASGKTRKAFGAKPEREAVLPKKPVTTMLRKAGGVDPTSTLAGELRAMGINARTAPGLFRAGGRGAADNFVRAEHPLFADGPDDGNGYIPEGEILEALRREMAGDPIRSADQLEAAERSRSTRDDDGDFQPRSERQRSRNVTNSVTEVERLIDVYGYPNDAEFVDLAVSFMDQGVDPEDAMIAATERLLNTELTADETDRINDAIGIPFFGAELEGEPEGRLPWDEPVGEAMGADDARAARDGEGDAGAGREAGQAPAGGEREREAGSRSPSEEVGADGKPQLVIPGAEADVRNRNDAQRLADERMRTNRPQSDMDFGMFGTAVDQLDLVDAARAAERKTPGAALPTATAPEHVIGVDDRELGQIVKEFADAQASMIEGDDAVSNIFAAPKKGEIVRLNKKSRVYHEANGWMTVEEAKAKIAEWKASAQAQGSDPAIRSANSNKVVLSLFDLSGEWSKPWAEAGYQVFRFDIQADPEMGDVNAFSTDFFGDWFGDFDGMDIHAILAACPCTDFAVSGARHFAAKDADGRTVASVKLVQQTLATIEHFKPAVWAIENPVGRIEKLGGLPPWRLSFDPNDIGDPYTKKTLLWGRFNADLEVAPVDPVEGSKMWSQYGGKSQATKNARSVTPEGFSYAFFAANNAHDHPAMAIANKFDRLDGELIREAMDAGVTADAIQNAVEDLYYMDMDDAGANDAIRALMAPAPAPVSRETPAEAETAAPTSETVTAPTETVTEAAPASETVTPAKPARKGKAKKPSLTDRLRNYFQPGREVPAYGGGTDTVLEFNEGAAGQWTVTVSGDDGEIRTHSTWPSMKQLDAWEKTNPIATEPAQGGRDNGTPEPLADDRSGTPRGASAEAARPAQGEGSAGDLAGSEGGGSAPADGRAAGAGVERAGGAGSRDGAPSPDAGADAGGEAGARAVRDGERGAVRDAGRGRSDFRITAPEEIGAGGQKTKFDGNLRAIELLEALGGRIPTDAEKAILSRYVGWGGIPQAFKKPDGTYADGWQDRAQKLEKVLTKDQLAAARRSTQDAHYTSPQIVSAIWSAVQRLGFKNGRVLEPSVGVGNFLGLRPDGVNARFTAVEYDDTTAAIAKALYGNADVHHQGFQDFTAPDGYFDLAIGNPPFGSQKLFDPKRAHLNNFSIHNMFFAKSVDLLRSDGVLAMVVSNAFLDAVVKDKARRYIADKTQFLGAIRLPNNAFSKNAGTDVTTDIIFLRKLKEGEVASGETWVDTAYVPDPLGGEDMPLNEYFVRNPDMMLGDFGRHGSMYRGGLPALIARDGLDMDGALTAAIAKLPRDVMGNWTNEIVERSKSAQVDRTVKVGSMFLDENGGVSVRGEDFGTNRSAESAGLEGKALERAKGMIQVRDVLTDLRALQLDEASTDRAIETQRGKLNAAYDAFVKAHGPISTDANRRIFGEDPTWPQLAALEDAFDKGISATVAKRTGETPRAPSAKKAAIFSKRTQSPYRAPTSAATAKDALTSSLSIAGRVDLDLMSRLAGRTESSLFDELAGTGLLFRAPDGAVVTREEYLSGNVKAKLAEAREAAKRDRALESNVAALERVQPVDIEAADIDVKPGAHWVPPRYIVDFIHHITGGAGASATYSRLTGQWTIKLGRVTPTAEVEYGTSRADVGATLRAALEQRSVQVYDQIDRDTRELNQPASEAATEKARKIADEWRRWVWTDDARRRDMAALYNEQFNTTVAREYDGSHLTFPGKVGDDIIKLRPHQANSVWRMVQGGTTLLDHVVGAGKTFTMIAGAMELRRTGFARKPMFAVPNHLVGQWAEDFVKLYPGARILAATKKDFEKNNRKRLMARISTGDWDAVIVAHSSFGKIELDHDFQRQIIDEQLADIDDAIRDMKAEALADKGGTDDRTVKQAEKQRESLQEKLKRLSESGAKDDNLTLGELGVDALFLDEAHEFKNLAFITKQRGVMGLGNPTGSQKAMDMWMKTQFILRRNGDRNVVHATGTPISNTMAEMFTVGRYLDYADMRARGIVHFDAWARQFGEVVNDWEISPSGKYKLTSRFARFVNMPELMQRYLTFADVINRDDINRQLAAQGKKLPIPKIKGGKPQNIIVPRSNDQATYIGIPLKDADGNDTETYPEGSLVWRSENMPKRPEKGADNMLKIMGDARKAALDMRLVDPDYPDNPGSKINEAANRIRTLYDRWGNERGTQLVFIDLSTPKAAKGKEAARIRELIDAAEGSDVEKAEAAQLELDKLSPDEIDALSADFSVYDDLRSKLIQRGIPEAEIAFIHDANTELQKDELFGKVRSGRIRVLFGSTAKMGAGMNVQNRLVGLHHMDAPWRPSDLEQREGRIIRQGNELYAADPDGFEVEINRYATERTLDARMWQTIEAKARFIEQVRKGAGGREIEDVGGEAANAAEMKAAASGNPDILAEMSLRKTIRTLENQRREHMREITRTADTVDMLKTQIARMKRDVPLYRADAKIDTSTFTATVGKTSFDKMGEAADALVKEAKKRTEKGATQGQLGTLFGVPLRFDVVMDETYLTLETKIPHEARLGEDAKALGAVMKLRNAVNASTTNADGYEAQIVEKTAEVKKLEARGAPEWPKEAEFQKTREEHDALLVKLRPKAKAPAAAKPVDGDAQASAPEGWGEVESGETPRLSEDEQAEVRAIVQRVAGLSDTEFRDTIQVPTTHPSFAAWGRQGKDGETVGIAGFYTATRDAIVIALDTLTAARKLAYHESFHRLQRLFLTDQEKALLANETETLRALVASSMGRERQAANMSQSELEAEAFAIYATRMEAGRPAPLRIKARIRAAWDRIRTAAKRVRNYLNGLGYQTLEDVFDRAMAGETKARNPDGTFKKVDPSFSIAEDGTAATAPQGFLAKGQLIERAFRAPFDFFGATAADGEWKASGRVFDKAADIIGKQKFGTDSSFAWLNGYIETARAGWMDRHGQDPAYVARDRQRGLDERRVMMQGAEVLKSLASNDVGPAEAKVLQAILTGDAVDDAAMQKLAEPIRNAIDALGQEAVNLGLLSAESYERNRGAYLHRVYLKHEASDNGLVRLANQIMGASRKKIIGNQLKGRGIFFEVAADRLTKDDAEWKAGRRGDPQKGDKVRVLDDVQQDMLGGPEKVVRRVYLPAGAKVPAEFAGFRDQGTWEVRGQRGGKVTIWRDYTKTERGKMGEILDARYTIAKTYMLMAHDLANGRFFADVAKNEEWTRHAPPPSGTWKEASDVSRYFADPEVMWVKVPDTTIGDTGGKKRWGALAGQFVRAEIWRDLNEVRIMNEPTMWRTLLSQWKANKTLRSPVVHMNNVMSNLMFMDLADVRGQDLVAGITAFVKGDRHYREALENGAFGADMMSQEIRKSVLQPILDDLVKSQQDGADNSLLARAGVLGKLADQVWKAAKRGDQFMFDAYRVEDEVFRMAVYMRRRQLGDSAQMAANTARDTFLDYDIRAPWVNALRNTVLPFLSYTYRATPLVARAIATRPWKLAKYATIAFALNALAYAWDDDGDEEEERASLRDEEQGRTWLGVHRMLRLPFRNGDDLPIFLDIRRWLPMGDIFDTNQGQSVVPLPAPMMPGGPLMLGAELALNRSAFTGQDIINPLTDTLGDRASKSADYLWKAWMPSAVWVPNSWYWEKVANAISGATDSQGRPYGVPEAFASSVGIKAKPQDVEMGLMWKGREIQRVEQELRAQARALARQRERGLISQRSFEAGMASIMEKVGNLGERAEALSQASR